MDDQNVYSFNISSSSLIISLSSVVMFIFVSLSLFDFLYLVVVNVFDFMKCFLIFTFFRGFGDLNVFSEWLKVAKYDGNVIY